MEAHRSALPRPELPHQPDGRNSVLHIPATGNCRPERRPELHQTLAVAPTRRRWTCWICGSVVSLETCNTDEYGQAVHGECYVARLALETASAQWVSRSRDKQEKASAGR
jgi:hypothetical protein